MKFRLPKRIAGVRVRRPIHHAARRLPAESGRIAAALAAPLAIGIVSALVRMRSSAAIKASQNATAPR